MLHIVGGALIGAAFGVAASAIYAKATGRKLTARLLIAGAIGGMVGGVITTATLGAGGLAAATATRALTAYVGGSAGGSATDQAVLNLLEGRPVGEGVVRRAAIGGATGAITFGAGKVLAPVAGKVVQGIKGRFVAPKAAILPGAPAGTVMARTAIPKAGGLPSDAAVPAKLQPRPGPARSSSAVSSTRAKSPGIVGQLDDMRGSGKRTAGKTVVSSGQTAPTGRPGGLPSGRPTRFLPGQNAENVRALTREVEAGETLAKAGYRVVRNPSVAGPKNPDYLIEGRIFDCYAPGKTTPANNVVAAIARKVGGRQADRIVLNLDDSALALDGIRGALREYPVDGLREVLVVRGGQVTSLFPN